MVQIDYSEHMKHLGVGMTEQEKLEATLNGIHNNIGALISMFQILDHRVKELEEKLNELP